MESAIRFSERIYLGQSLFLEMIYIILTSAQLNFLVAFANIMS